MRNTFKIVTTFLALTFLIEAQALERGRRSVRSTDAPAATSYSTSETNIKGGFGFATYGGSSIAASHSLSAMFDLNPTMSFQGLFAIFGSDPFTFGVGGIFRKAVAGDLNGGLTLGLGANLGTVRATGAAATSPSEFFLNIFPVAGFGFSLGGAASNVRLNFDGGPVFHVTPNFTFSVIPLSGQAGASIHYMF